VGEAVGAAVGAYVREVREQTFPADEHSFHAPSLRLLHAVEEEPRDDAQVMGAPV
jgi:3-methyl-2-oxobutanoate hydroxymethyltransferase